MDLIGVVEFKMRFVLTEHMRVKKTYLCIPSAKVTNSAPFQSRDFVLASEIWKTFGFHNKI